ncbi:trans-aconitate 2-methyltransferase [Yersinia intermedia]|jgi:trans-aconitate 2-methyltransferase|uniref:Trans-aconitate 2-methyltransferase n=1 Tax=Yersinia intermedia TaxID=631 RepID=A0A209A6I6_YERIN|nr:trans-aconitate 2-methyltransferase [Yersinia intermedia]MCB5311308.1 trans-aconitate 2-methyltransferase [Yersinia intermedia]MCB5325802.1 trans-aconitate 2-methyltransferase [Yersinia intermedia]OVZ88346.1 trans-aconitate 2-methyltransferase [Yersinia intermedia]UZM69785.1 trans-aconitate 2-methyltransferase [Yersinia intermedia]CNB42008.1 trans-aconitate 2-methyltransferase [Yersinia intermedia]
MQDWDPELYRQFEAERTRPASDLLARISTAQPQHISDLGCGPGNSTQLLHQRFPLAQLVGIDNSVAMLASAQQRLPECAFLEADIRQWQPSEPQDLIYANASLQWLTDHQQLFPSLLSKLATHGILAVQMPDNQDEPSHRAMREVAENGPWQQTLLEAGAIRAKVLSANQYYDLLAPKAERVDIWRTTYYHPMPSAQAIVDWLRATGLRPFLEPLSEAMRLDFLQDYLAIIDVAYPQQADGRRLLAFPRLFIVAHAQ